MTLIEFMKSQLSKGTQFGDLAKYIQSDKELLLHLMGSTIWDFQTQAHGRDKFGLAELDTDKNKPPGS